MTVPVFFFFAISLARALTTPTVTDASVTLRSATMDDVALTLALEVENTNAKDVRVDGLKADVTVEGVAPLHAESTRAVTLKARSKTKYTLPLAMPWKSALAISQKIIGKKPVPYRVKGSAKIAGRETPFDHSGQLPVR